MQHACIISCSVTTGFYSAVQQAKVTPGSTCAVWGMGAIGLNALKGCQHQRAQHVVAIDINPAKRDMAFSFGATEFVNPRELDRPLDQWLMERFPCGVDFAFDCFGSQQIVDVALRSLSPFGTFAMVGLAKAGTKIDYPTADLLYGRRIVGGFLGQKKIDQAYDELVQMYLDGRYDIDRLITNKFRLEQINEAFQTLKDGKCIRSLIIF